MKLAICIPWRSIGDESRDRAHDWVLSYVRRAGFSMIFEGSGSSRAEMCNNAARYAISYGADVLFFLDADTWIPTLTLWAAAEHSLHEHRFVHAFTEYHRLDVRETRRCLAIDPYDFHTGKRPNGGRMTKKHVSGASAISVDLWNEIGGFDERFTTYGLEDRAFHLAAETIGGSVERIEGPAYHWWHKTDPNKGVRHHKNDERVKLIEHYCRAAGYVPDYGQLGKMGQQGMVTVPKDAVPCPAAMKLVLMEPGGPLSSDLPEQVV